MRNRIYSALSFLVHEGYLREARPTPVPPHVSLDSDYFFPTEKAFRLVDRRQAPWYMKAWHEIADRGGGMAAIISAVVSAIFGTLFKWLG